MLIILWYRIGINFTELSYCVDMSVNEPLTYFKDYEQHACSCLVVVRYELVLNLFLWYVLYNWTQPVLSLSRAVQLATRWTRCTSRGWRTPLSWNRSSNCRSSNSKTTSSTTARRTIQQVNNRYMYQVTKTVPFYIGFCCQSV